MSSDLVLHGGGHGGLALLIQSADIDDLIASLMKPLTNLGVPLIVHFFNSGEEEVRPHRPVPEAALPTSFLPFNLYLLPRPGKEL